MFGNLLKAVVGLVVVTPVSLVADVIMIGGAMTDKDEPYTATALRNVVKSVQDSVK